MCIAIVIPKGQKVTEDQMRNSHRLNDHGMGLAYIKGKKLALRKTMDLDQFINETYPEALKEAPDSNMLMHFRLSTGGEKDLTNVHPFIINDGLVFMHNGSIYGLKDDPDKKKCDTVRFNEQILQSLPFGWEKNPGIRALIEKMIGTSKIITMDVTGHYEIFNEDAGHWKDGIWWSNYSYVSGTTKASKYSGKKSGGSPSWADYYNNNRQGYIWMKCPTCGCQKFMLEYDEECEQCFAARCDRIRKGKQRDNYKSGYKSEDKDKTATIGMDAETPGVIDLVAKAYSGENNQYVCPYCDNVAAEHEMRLVKLAGPEQEVVLMCRACLNEFNAVGLQIAQSEILQPRHYVTKKEMSQ